MVRSSLQGVGLLYQVKSDKGRALFSTGGSDKIGLRVRCDGPWSREDTSKKASAIVTKVTLFRQAGGYL